MYTFEKEPAGDLIIKKDGAPIGYLGITLKDEGRIAYVDRITQISDTPIGAAAVRQIARAYLKANPVVETITGNRLTGARPAAAVATVTREQIIGE